jgi:hypothetical protein
MVITFFFSHYMRTLKLFPRLIFKVFILLTSLSLDLELRIIHFAAEHQEQDH